MNLSGLRPLYDQPGHWASAYLDASRDTEDARTRFDLRWRALGESLADQGADKATLDAMAATLRDEPPRPGHYGLALFASDGQVRLVEALPVPPRADLASWGPLPHAMPMVAQRGGEVAWLRVVADRTGADLAGITAGGVPHNERVQGSETYPIRKAKPGGWSQPRYQNAAEQAWHRNAGDAAAATVDLAEQIGAEALVVAGDVRAVQLLLDQLPQPWLARVVRTDAGSRAPGADPEPLDDVTAQTIADVAAQHTEAVLDRYREQCLGGRAAGSGLAAVVAALQRGQADTVLIVDDPASDAELWIGPEPTQLAIDADELRAMGVAQPRRARADAALLRAVAGTGAELMLVGPGDAPLAGGLGVLLRYADASTRH